MFGIFNLKADEKPRKLKVFTIESRQVGLPLIIIIVTCPHEFPSEQKKHPAET